MISKMRNWVAIRSGTLGLLALDVVVTLMEWSHSSFEYSRIRPMASRRSASREYQTELPVVLPLPLMVTPRSTELPEVLAA